MSEETEVRDPQGLLAAYEKAKKDLVELREERAALQKEFDEYKEENSPDTVGKWRNRSISRDVKMRLESEGIKDADRVLKYLDLEGLDYDDKDQLVGFDDRLTEVKKDFPELFDVKRRAGRSSADIHADNPADLKEDPFRAQVRAALTHSG